MLTPHSLYAAVSIGLETPTIIAVLNRLSKSTLPEEVKAFVRASTENYGKARFFWFFRSCFGFGWWSWWWWW